MRYEQIVANVARRSGLTHERVKAVLQHLPPALMALKEGDKVRTPLGVFVMMRTKTRKVTLPDGSSEASVPSKAVVKLRPGVALRK